MLYVEEHDVLKVPHVHSWSTHGPDGIGPYILMDFIDGEELAKCLGEWAKSDKPDDLKKCDLVYEQLAEMLWQLYRHKFDRIGSITKTPEGQWAITKRPLRLDMYHQVLGVPGFPVDTWPTSPLLRSQDYKAIVVDILNHQLEHLPKLNIPVEVNKQNGDYVQQEGDKINMARALEIARGRFIARHAFAMPAATSFLEDADTGPFVVFNPDFCPRNMLVDSKTAEITAVVDFEFTNTMPASFAHDVPLWLLPWALEKTLDLDLFPWWMQTYQPAVERFLAAMERVEARQQQQGQEPPLDAIYCALPEKFPKPDKDPLMEKEVEAYQVFTKGQITAYEEQRAAQEGHE